MEKRKYRAICFDLDGTLLGMDIDDFMKAYFARIAKWAGTFGLDSERFIVALKSGTRAMALSDDDRTNKEVFWDEFSHIYGQSELEGLDVLAIADEFYLEDFNHIGDGFEYDPVVPKTLETLRAKGYPLLLTTMPMFPLQAVKHRLSWAGIDSDIFDRITSYENSKTTKPRQSYFAENLAAMGVLGEDVLMVGNNTMEDLAFLDLGADCYLVTDWLLDPLGYDLDTVKHGTFKEFASWVEKLPVCDNPALDIERESIEHAKMRASYEKSISSALDPKSTEENSKRLADAIESDTPLGKE